MDKKLVFLTGLQMYDPVDLMVLEEIEKHFQITLPKDYKDFMLSSNGADGTVGDRANLSLWGGEDIIEFNKAYKVDKYAPGLILFGSDGKTEAYAFDANRENLPIVGVPLLAISLDDVYECGVTFNDFLEYLSVDSKKKIKIYTKYEYAGIIRRGIALYIDFFIIGLVCNLLIIIADSVSEDAPVLAFIFGISSLLAFFLYFAIMESSSEKATFGKKIVGICVVDIEGNNISFTRALLRTVLKFFTFGIGLYFVLFTSKHQSIHDLASKTLIIRNDANKYQPDVTESEQCDSASPVEHDDEEESSNDWF